MLDKYMCSSFIKITLLITPSILKLFPQYYCTPVTPVTITNFIENVQEE